MKITFILSLFISLLAWSLTIQSTYACPIFNKFLKKGLDEAEVPNPTGAIYATDKAADKAATEAAAMKLSKNEGGGSRRSRSEASDMGDDLADRNIKDRRGTDRREYDQDQRAIIDDIKNKMGPGKRRHYLETYNFNNIHHLNDRDLVYFTGLAEIVEKDIIIANPKLSTRAITRKTKKVLNELVNSCKHQ